MLDIIDLARQASYHVEHDKEPLIPNDQPIMMRRTS